jgi:hypothetical protein
MLALPSELVAQVGLDFRERRDRERRDLAAYLRLTPFGALQYLKGFVLSGLGLRERRVVCQIEKECRLPSPREAGDLIQGAVRAFVAAHPLSAQKEWKENGSVAALASRHYVSLFGLCCRTIEKGQAGSAPLYEWLKSQPGLELLALSVFARFQVGARFDDWARSLILSGQLDLRMLPSLLEGPLAAHFVELVPASREQVNYFFTRRAIKDGKLDDLRPLLEVGHQLVFVQAFFVDAIREGRVEIFRALLPLLDPDGAASLRRHVLGMVQEGKPEWLSEFPEVASVVNRGRLIARVTLVAALFAAAYR